MPKRIFSKPSHPLQIRPTTGIRTKFHRYSLTADAIHGPSVHVPFFQFVQRMQKTSNSSPSPKTQTNPTQIQKAHSTVVT